MRKKTLFLLLSIGWAVVIQPAQVCAASRLTKACWCVGVACAAVYAFKAHWVEKIFCCGFASLAYMSVYRHLFREKYPVIHAREWELFRRNDGGYLFVAFDLLSNGCLLQRLYRCDMQGAIQDLSTTVALDGDRAFDQRFRQALGERGMLIGSAAGIDQDINPVLFIAERVAHGLHLQG